MNYYSLTIPCFFFPVFGKKTAVTTFLVFCHISHITMDRLISAYNVINFYMFMLNKSKFHYLRYW